MKKITFLFICSALSLSMNAQQTISFEASEGYTAGDIHNQNGWTTTGCGPGCFISNQVVTDEQSTNGTYSLKIANEGGFPGQEGTIVGAFYDFATPVDYTTATVSFDFYATQQDGNGADFRIGIVGTNAQNTAAFNMLVDFGYQGNIRVVDANSSFLDVGTWVANTWYNVRIEVAGTTATYFLDDVQVSQQPLLTVSNFNSMRFVHDNWGGDGYVDNIRINDEELSVGEFTKNAIRHNYNKTDETFNFESSISPLTNVEIYSILGHNVISKSLTGFSETIDVSSLSAGVYLAKVYSNGNSETIKFIKN